ncbi:GNAT family N-acetyltransferase [Acidaminobacter sp. JC074]|uniref:GNAT family N-acetyltransferase n=1 Tax=Acidaminobacter sp. JC074 TaxID=2530199 RepID=UPI001F0F3965|nr:GNAT family N-acetyltransferase [Acidaminobacter sp. JC074]MCH4890973.1 GNAT family N-acetyltransferase [Acidaminobacter sp. JC074]
MIENMTSKYAKEIVKWVYEKPYDIYGMPDGYDEIMSSFYAVTEGDLIGFFCLDKHAQVPPYEYDASFVDFGIGLRPDLCGKGHGESFMREVMAYIDKPLRLTVLAWNTRAISLYKKLGFKEVDRFFRGDRQFIVMTQ